MKKYIISLIVLVIMFSNKTIAQTNDSVVNRLLQIDESLFINKPLDSIIAKLPSGYISMKVYGLRATARSLVFLYPNRVWIDLHVRQFSYMNPVDENKVWNALLMRKEPLFKTAIYKGSICYRNCELR